METVDRTSARLPEGLLLSRRSADLRIETEPFTRFRLDGVFEPEDYRQILREFRSACDRVDLGAPKARKGKSGKSAVSSAEVLQFGQMLACAPRFEAMVGFMASAEFLRDLQHLFADAIRAAHPDIWDDAWTAVPDDWKPGAAPVDGTPVKINFQFGRMHPGAFLTPHKDGVPKIVTLIFYMSPKDWEPSWHGGTSFYQVPFREGTCDLSNVYYAFDDVTRIDELAFRPNRMVGFVKSRRSFHGVAPVACPNGRTRDSFIVNVNRAIPPRTRPIARRLNRLIDRLAGRRPSA